MEDALLNARDEVMIGRYTKKGVTCKCCDKYAKVYKRSIGVRSLRVLMELYWLQSGPDALTWVKIGNPGKIHTAGGDYAKMRWWGLIESKNAIRKDGSRRAGFWRITDHGRSFVECRVQVRKYYYEYNNDLVSDPVNADESLVYINKINKGFNYAEVMSVGGV